MLRENRLPLAAVLITHSALAAAWICPPGVCQATGLNRTDKLRVLYSNQFAFDRRGVPIITIGIAEGEASVTIEGDRAVRVLPDGEDGSEVTGGRRWTVSLRRSKPAVVEHFVVLAREPASAFDKLQQQRRTWTGRGARVRVIESGTLFGVRGKVFDNRAYVLAEGPFPSDAAARAAGERYHRQKKLPMVGVIRQLKRRPSGLLIARNSDGTGQVKVRDVIWFAPRGRTPLRIRRGKGPARAYWGQIYVTVDRRGKLAVVNAVPADRLLAGLVPAEIFSSAPRAALQAQAVAARGDLLAKIGSRHHVDPFLICAKQHCQVYRGAGSEHPRTTEAVSATKGQVLVRRDGRLVKTVYSAACGGHTEHNDEVWAVEAESTLRGHLDGPSISTLRPFESGITASNIHRWLDSRPPTWCARSSYNRTKYRWTKRVRASALAPLARKLGVGPIRNLRVLSRGVSGRANLIEVQGALGKANLRGELRIRRGLGGLRSSMFLVSRQAGPGGSPVFVFKGGGWGHGVGMCQTGATGMAQAGKDFKQILGHYYLKSNVERLY